MRIGTTMQWGQGLEPPTTLRCLVGPSRPHFDSHAQSNEETGFRVWGSALFVGQFDPMWAIRASSNEAVGARAWLY